MKNFRLLPAMVMLTMFTFFSCEEDDDTQPNQPTPCTEKQENDQVTVNGFDYNPVSPYFNQAVCIFTIRKETTKRSGNCAAQPLMECENSVSIKNLTPYTISFSYSLRYALNAYRWEYQSTVSIAPGQTTGFEHMNDNCGSLQLSAISIVSPLIRYY